MKEDRIRDKRMKNEEECGNIYERNFYIEEKVEEDLFNYNLLIK